MFLVVPEALRQSPLSWGSLEKNCKYTRTACFLGAVFSTSLMLTPLILRRPLGCRAGYCLHVAGEKQRAVPQVLRGFSWLPVTPGSEPGPLAPWLRLFTSPRCVSQTRTSVRTQRCVSGRLDYDMMVYWQSFSSWHSWAYILCVNVSLHSIQCDFPPCLSCFNLLIFFFLLF